jgi:hypothetical protein
MQKQNYELDFTGQDIYAGIDAHLKSWKITIMLQSKDINSRIKKRFYPQVARTGFHCKFFEVFFIFDIV